MSTKLKIEFDLLEELFQPMDTILPYYQGDVVEIADAKNCIDEFKKKMAGHGFIDGPITGTPPLPSVQVDVMQVTHSVSFGGSGFSMWIANLRERAGSLSNIQLNVEFGIYTQGFIDEYQLPGALLGRITAFVIPYKVQLLVAVGGSPADPFGDDGYNLGGLQP